MGEDSLHRKPSGENVFYIEHFPGGLFSVGDAFLYDICVVAANANDVDCFVLFFQVSVQIFSEA